MFQFAHMNTYARTPQAGKKGKKAHSVNEILDETERVPENCPHVIAPQRPKVIAGMSPADLRRNIDDIIKSRKIEGKRAPRGDIHVLAAAVYSWPETVQYHDHDRLDKFIEDTLKFHREHIGEIDSAVLHMDEEYPHIHVYIVDPDARRLSPGWVAKREAESKGENSATQNQRYKEAMVGFQDKYYEEVGMLNGLARIGPKRQRLTRREFRESKPARLAAADDLRAAQERALIAQQRADYIEENARLLDAKAIAAEERLKTAEENARVSEKRAEVATETARLSEENARTLEAKAEIAIAEASIAGETKETLKILNDAAEARVKAIADHITELEDTAKSEEANLAFLEAQAIAAEERKHAAEEIAFADEARSQAAREQLSSAKNKITSINSQIEEILDGGTEIAELRQPTKVDAHALIDQAIKAAGSPKGGMFMCTRDQLIEVIKVGANAATKHARQDDEIRFAPFVEDAKKLPLAEGLARRLQFTVDDLQAKLDAQAADIDVLNTIREFVPEAVGIANERRQQKELADNDSSTFTM